MEMYPERAINIKVGQLLWRSKVKVTKVTGYPYPRTSNRNPDYVLIEYIGEDGLNHATIVKWDDPIFVNR